MDSMDKNDVEYGGLGVLCTRTDVFIRDKQSLVLISILKGQPIIRCGNRYVVVDGTATAYIYEEK